MRHLSRLLALANAVLFVTIVISSTPAAARDVVAFRTGAAPGTIVIKTSQRRLYFVLGNGRAIRYPVGVGKSGKRWTGRTFIDGKHIKPAWSPPADVRRDHPRIPYIIPGGSPRNPMGAAALTLSGGQYAIHGTNRPGSVGRFVSYGCIRMYNRDIVDLYRRVSFGTPVHVLR